MSFLRRLTVSPKTPDNEKGVFGRDLNSLLKEQQRSIPIIVQQCIEWLEQHGGLLEEGLFRISGNTTQIQRLIYYYNKDPKSEINFEEVLGEKIQLHTLAGLLKVFFRELPQPILTYRFYATFIKVQKNNDGEARLKNIRVLVRGLPPNNRALLLYLAKFLNKIAENSHLNKMTPSNLATCWAPNLLRDENETLEKMVYDTGHVNAVVASIIENVDFMAVEKSASCAPTAAEEKIMKEVEEEERKQMTILSSPNEGKVLFEEVDGKLQGWVTKQGGSVKTWKRRWFIFEPKELVIYYYKTTKDVAHKQPLGKVPILGYKLQKVEEKDNIKKPFPFKLHHPGPCRTWFFSAGSEEARDSWMASINNAVEEWLKKGGDTAQSEEKELESQVEDSDDDEEEEEVSFFIPPASDESHILAEEQKIEEEEQQLKEEEIKVAEQEAALQQEEKDIAQMEQLQSNGTVVVEEADYSQIAFQEESVPELDITEQGLGEEPED